MAQKVLLLWLWVQGKKYVSFFSERNYIIDGVNTSGNADITLNQIYSFQDIQAVGFCFDMYDYIVIAVAPQSEQSKVIHHLLDSKIQNKIIIEKPVSYDLKLLSTLSEYENIIYFIDEIYVSPFLKKLDNISFPLTLKTKRSLDVIEHAMSIFILREDFDAIISRTHFEFISALDNYWLQYNFKFGNYECNINKGEFYINDNYVCEVSFEKSLAYVLKLHNDQKNKILFKNNFYILIKELLQLKNAWKI